MLVWRFLYFNKGRFKPQKTQTCLWEKGRGDVEKGRELEASEDKVLGKERKDLLAKDATKRDFFICLYPQAHL